MSVEAAAVSRAGRAGTVCCSKYGRLSAPAMATPAPGTNIPFLVSNLQRPVVTRLFKPFTRRRYIVNKNKLLLQSTKISEIAFSGAHLNECGGKTRYCYK